MKTLVTVLLVAVANIASAQSPDATATLVVTVTSQDGAPLGYSVVQAGPREVFTNAAGQATLTKLPAGRVQLRVRHLGYTPIDLATTVHANRVDTVRVAMQHIAVALGAVHVRALGVCENPGPPRAASDPAFAAIFEQLRENADQYRVLATTYPFVSTMQRMSWIHYVGGDSVWEAVDTISIGSGLKWHYAPGDVVGVTDDPGRRQVVFNIPTLFQFAEQSFINNHCFVSSGVDTVEGTPAIRVDFAAAARIKAPDVDGAMYLDPATFQIRRSVLRLTRIPPESPQVSGVEVVTDFREVYPSIPVVSSIRSTHTLFADRTRPVLPDVRREMQRLLRVTFLETKPGETVPPD